MATNADTMNQGQCMKTKSGDDLNPIGIGTWGMGGDRFEGGDVFADYRYDRREVDAIRYSISKGQNHIDTAQLYGAGHTEEIVGEAIKDIDREALYIATKVWRTHSLRNAIPHMAEESLRKLGTDYIDLLYVHAPWDSIEMSEYISGLNDTIDAGLVREIGVSNFTREQLEKACGMSKHPIAANQVLYNLIERRSIGDGLLEFCIREGIVVVAYRPVERRLLADKTDIVMLKKLSARLGVTVAQLAIAWLVGQENVITIPKSSEKTHIDENLEAMKIPISQTDRELLDSISR
jgi:diketogulonate reductase-like aldo/keto reductase